MLSWSCSEDRVFYFAYSSYGNVTEVYSSPSLTATVLEELPSPSNQIEILDERYDESEPFTHIKTAEGIYGYILSQNVRSDIEYGNDALRMDTGEHIWVRDKYAFEKVAEAGSYTVANILYFMKSMSWHKYNFDEAKWTYILVGLGLLAFLIHCVGWCDVELGAAGYWLLNTIYWLCYLAILFCEFVVFCMHSPIDSFNTSTGVEGSFLYELIVGFLLLALLLYSIVVSFGDTTNMLGSLIPQGAFGQSGYATIDFNKGLTLLFIVIEGISIWLIPSIADTVLFVWLGIQGVILIALLISALVSGHYFALFTTLIYAVLFPIIVFILVNVAVTMGILALGLYIIIMLFAAPFLAPQNAAPTGFVLRDSSGNTVDEIDAEGYSLNSSHRYERTSGDGWKKLW